MKIFDRYLFKNLSIANLIVAVILATIIFLTQSLRFLDLVLNAGGSGNAFWILTLLALPRFFEIILPLSTMAATLFIYNKMLIDSEITAIRAAGLSPMALAQPVLALAFFISIILWNTTFWIAPASVSQMQKMRSELTTEFSNILFREGIFNAVGKGLTVYIKDRNAYGELEGLMIYDSRNESAPPTTILAKRGMMVEGENGPQVVVFDGSKQEYNKDNNILQRLSFDRYTIDLPNSGPVSQRWAEPEERSIWSLMRPNLSDERDKENLREFKTDFNKRISAPFLAITFPVIALCFLLLGPIDRRGQNRRIMGCILTSIILQSSYLSVYSLARNSDVGIFMLYLVPILPLIIGLFLLSKKSENLRYSLFYNARQRIQKA